MSKELIKQRKITPRDTIKAMRENSIEVSEKDADIVLDFLYFLAKLTVNQYINDEDSEDKTATF